MCWPGAFHTLLSQCLNNPSLCSRQMRVLQYTYISISKYSFKISTYLSQSLCCAKVAVVQLQHCMKAALSVWSWLGEVWKRIWSCISAASFCVWEQRCIGVGVTGHTATIIRPGTTELWILTIPELSTFYWAEIDQCVLTIRKIEDSSWMASYSLNYTCCRC